MTDINTHSIIFILSLGRSGSTYLLNILKTMPDKLTCYEHEWNFMRDYKKIPKSSNVAPLSDYLRHYKNDSKKIKKVEEAISKYDLNREISLEEFIGLVAETLCNENNNKFVIKTTDLYNFGLYKKNFPNAKFLINIRNPVYYITSFHLFWAEKEFDLHPVHWALPIQYECIKTIENCFKEAWVHVNDISSKIVKLEDIQTNNKAVARKKLSEIINFIGVHQNHEKINQMINSKYELNRMSNLKTEELEKNYNNFGLTRIEKLALNQNMLFIEYFYPNIKLSIEDVRTSNYIIRFLKQERVILKKKKNRLYYLRLIKRAFTIFRFVF